MRLFVNTSELIGFSKKLDKISKRALPFAVKGALNSAAFDVKKRTLPQEAGKSFINRDRNFYKRFSKVKMANGTNINSMQSRVGMFGNTDAVKNQTKQQIGGNIKDSFVPFDTARTSNTFEKKVKKRDRLKSIGNDLSSVVNTDRFNGSAQKRYVVGVTTAANKNELMMHRSRKGNNVLYRVTFGGRVKLGSKSYKVTPLYSVKGGRSYNVKKKKPFTLNAANRSGKKLDEFFVKNAKRQIARMR